jgi:hypothetical protein
MTKEELKQHYNTLDNIHGEFLIAYERSKVGKNKQIREKASKDFYSSIGTAENYINRLPELFHLLVDFADGNSFLIDEFFNSTILEGI